MILNVLLFKITLGCYLAGTILFLFSLWSPRQRPARLSVGATVLGFTFHTAGLVARGVEGGYFPLSSPVEAMVFFSWTLVLIFLGVEYRHRVHVLGSLILPLALISLVSVATVPEKFRSLPSSLQGAWLGFHTTLSLLGIAGFTLAFVAGVVYLVEERLLKSKRFNGLYRKLPSLELLDAFNRRAIFLGFSLLTLGIITGSLWAGEIGGAYWQWRNPKQALAVVTWFFYLAMLHGRITIGWRAKRAAYLAIIGFIGVVFTVVALFLGTSPGQES